MASNEASTEGAKAQGAGTDRRRRRRARKRDQGILSLVPFLLPFAKVQWRLLLAALAVTAVYAGLNALRAPLAGVFTGHVILEDKGFGSGSATDVGVTKVPRPDASPPSSEGAGSPGGLETRARGWLERSVPVIGRVRAWWRDVQRRWERDDWLLFCALALAGIGILLGLANVGRSVLQQAVVLRVLVAIRVHVATHLMRLGLRFFHRQKLGDLYSRLTNDIGLTHQALKFLFVDLAEAMLLLLAYSGACLWASWKLSLFALAVGPVLFGVMRLFGRKIRRRSRGRQISQAEVTEEMQQMLTGIRIVKAFDNEAEQVARFRRANDTFYRRALRVVKVKSISRGVVEGLNHLAIAALVAVGVAYAVQRGLVSWSDLVVFMGSVALMYDPGKKIVRAYNNLSDALAAVDRVKELLAEEPEIRDREDAVPLDGVRGEVHVDRVTFAYDDAPVLSDVSFRAEPGEVVALVGESGAGKSTLVDLLARFYDPNEGAVRIDGHDLSTVQRSSYMRHVAMVTQEPFLFNDTVAANLRYAKPTATSAELETACRDANIHEAVAGLEAGYDTVLGERGVLLSGGQKQRLTIARAILKDPRVLLLDEATSALDSESERLVQEALERLMAGRTTIVVAHRLSTITGADRIVVLDQGRVVEEGSHAELIERGGRYARFYALQTEVAAT